MQIIHANLLQQPTLLNDIGNRSLSYTLALFDVLESIHDFRLLVLHNTDLYHLRKAENVKEHAAPCQMHPSRLHGGGRSDKD